MNIWDFLATSEGVQLIHAAEAVLLALAGYLSFRAGYRRYGPGPDSSTDEQAESRAEP